MKINYNLVQTFIYTAPSDCGAELCFYDDNGIVRIIKDSKEIHLQIEINHDISYFKTLDKSEIIGALKELLNEK